jgi:predicted nuclease of predicted toxin-antitoxin system
MRFLIDAQLPPALVRLLEDMSHEASHVLDHHLEASDDEAIWRKAERQRAVIISKDEDIATRVIIGRSGPSVVWIRIGKCSNRALLTWFRPLIEEVVRRIDQGERLIELI